jgi:CRISPR-associated endonuclease/helicase Cas3
MLRLLEVLLAFHAAGGGCAILLSATLPRRIRQKLVDAYCEGLERRGPTLQRTDYPLLTWIAPDHHDEIDLDTRPEVARLVRVDTVHATETAREILLTARAENRCACWIRNTVDDAIAAHELLCQAGVPEDDLILFHARFVLADRMEIENKVLNCFGPDSGGEQRRGKILVATQVIEQSLDLDFDVMLSDLAPIDLLIQRAGRLRRHCRDMAGNKADKEGRSTPRLWIFGPEFTETPSADWFRAFLPGAAAVYPNHGHIWLTARFLQQTGAIAMPEGARDLIENVYGEDAEADVPPALQSSVTKVMGDDSAKQSMASANTITLEKGYRDEGFDLWDETRIPTRLEDQPSVTVRLTCRENGALRPWRDSSSRYDWELSQVSVRYSLFADEEHDPTLETAVETCRTNMPDRGKWSRLLVLERENGIWVGRAKNGKGETVRLCYDSEKGLRKA